MKNENLVAEELIKQHPIMSELHPESVNTIRILTINGTIVGATLRIGAGGSRVDNASSGGCFATIDLESGIVTTCGHDFQGNKYLAHPTTGVYIPGFQIPFWVELCDLVGKAVALEINTPIIGWDVAISEDGPVLVEGNVGPGIRLMQVADKKGKRKWYTQVLKREKHIKSRVVS